MSDISAQHDDDFGELIVNGVGALDLKNSAAFRDQLEEATRADGDVTVGLSGATYVDTAVLQYLSTAATRMLAKGQRLKVIVADNSHPLKVLRMVGFHEIMDIVVSPVLSEGDR